MSRRLLVDYAQHRWALFADGLRHRYRYRLGRTWDPDGCRALFVMLNPSVADLDYDDPTVHGCAIRARNWGYGSIEVVNLYGLIATNPRELLTATLSVGLDNDRHIADAVSEATTVIAAWGAHRMATARAAIVDPLLGPRVYCLGVTKSGAPRHPLYVRHSQPLIDYRWDQE